MLLKFKDEFEGGIVRGVDRDFSWSSLTPYYEGISVFGDQMSREIVLSATMASKLGVQVGDRLTAFFKQRGRPSAQTLISTVAAIFETGFPTLTIPWPWLIFGRYSKSIDGQASKWEGW